MSSPTAQYYADSIIYRAKCATDAMKQLLSRVGCSSKVSELNHAIFCVLRNETRRYMKELSTVEFAYMIHVCQKELEEKEKLLQEEYGFDDTIIPEKYLTPELVIYCQVERIVSKHSSSHKKKYVRVGQSQ